MYLSSVVVVIILEIYETGSQIVAANEREPWASGEPWPIGTQNSRTVQSHRVLGRSKSSHSLWPLIISVKMKLSSESCFFREIWWVILCRTLICFQTKIPLRLFIRIRGSTKTHPTILGMNIPYLVTRDKVQLEWRKLVSPFFEFNILMPHVIEMGEPSISALLGRLV